MTSPKNTNFKRNKEICEKYFIKKGYSYWDLARIYNITPQRIGIIIKDKDKWLSYKENHENN